MSHCHYYHRSTNLEFYYKRSNCYISLLNQNQTTVIQCGISECQGDGGQNRSIVIENGIVYALLGFKLVEFLPDKIVTVRSLAVANKGINNMKIGGFQGKVIFTDGQYLYSFYQELVTKHQIQALYIYHWCGINLYKNQQGQLFLLVSLLEPQKNQLLYQFDATMEHVCCDSGCVVFRSRLDKKNYVVFDLTTTPISIYQLDKSFDQARKSELTDIGREFPISFTVEIMGDGQFQQFDQRRRVTIEEYNKSHQPINFQNRIKEIHDQHCWVPFDVDKLIQQNLGFYQLFENRESIGYCREKMYVKLLLKGVDQDQLSLKSFELSAPQMCFSSSFFGQCYQFSRLGDDIYHLVGGGLLKNDKLVVTIPNLNYDNAMFKLATFEDKIVVSDSEYLNILDENNKKLVRTQIVGAHVYQWLDKKLIWFDGKLKILKSLIDDSLNPMLDEYNSSGADICCEGGLFLSESSDGDSINIIDLTNYKFHNVVKLRDKRIFQGTWFDHYYLLCEYTETGRQLAGKYVELLLGTEEAERFQTRRKQCCTAFPIQPMPERLREVILNKIEKQQQQMIKQEERVKENSTNSKQKDFDFENGPLPSHPPISMNERLPMDKSVVLLINKALDFVNAQSTKNTIYTSQIEEVKRLSSELRLAKHDLFQAVKEQENLDNEHKLFSQKLNSANQSLKE